MCFNYFIGALLSSFSWYPVVYESRNRKQSSVDHGHRQERGPLHTRLRTFLLVDEFFLFCGPFEFVQPAGPEGTFPFFPRLGVGFFFFFDPDPAVGELAETALVSFAFDFVFRPLLRAVFDAPPTRAIMCSNHLSRIMPTITEM